MEEKQLTEKETLISQVRALKTIIRITYKTMKWISIFLLIPTIINYFLKITTITIARDIGIIIIAIYLIFIDKKLRKKEKEELTLKEIKEINEGIKKTREEIKEGKYIIK